MDLRKALPAILVYVILLAVIWLGYFVPRENFLSVVLLYSLAFGAYIVLAWKESYQSLKMILFIGVLLRLSLFVAQPTFSDDHHRFVWDGVLVANGMNPYMDLPSEMDLSTAPDGLSEELRDDLNSRDFHSVYPPVLQYFFGASAWMANGDREVTIIFLRIFVLLAEILSIWLIFQLLAFWELPTTRTLLYAFNPLVVVELTGNLHTEAFMICFTLLAIYLLVKNRILFSAGAMSLAIGAKLWPVIFLPFLVKRIGIQKALVYFAFTIAVLVLLFAPFWHEHFLGNFLSSIQLYFAYFEYNASFYAVLRWFFGPDALGRWSVIPILTLVALALLFTEDFLHKKRWTDLFSWPALMMWALALYLLFATTVHPWYVLPLLAFSLFTRYRWPLLWTVLLPFTYITYSSLPWQQNFWIIALEYMLLFIFAFAELNSYARLPWWNKKVAKGKVGLLMPWLKKGQRVLEVGSGNGGLTLLLREEGINITALDSVNKSHFDSVEPVLADAAAIPFQNRSFEVVQLITMLHHTPDPDAVLREAGRVGKQLIVMEDVYSNRLQKYLTWFMDSLANMEFKGHPHTNRTDEQWLKTFEDLGFELLEKKSKRTLLFFRQNLYFLNVKMER